MKTLISTVVLLLLMGCQKDESDSDQPNEQEDAQNFISAKIALNEIVESLAPDYAQLIEYKDSSIFIHPALKLSAVENDTLNLNFEKSFPKNAKVAIQFWKESQSDVSAEQQASCADEQPYFLLYEPIAADFQESMSINKIPVSGCIATKELNSTIITGSVKLGDGISIGDIGEQQALEGAVIYVANYPEINAISNQSGNFQLQLTSEVLANWQETGKLTIHGQGDLKEKFSSSKIVGTPQIRVVGTQEVTYSESSAIAIENFVLGYSRSINFAFVEAGSTTPITDCRVQSKELGFFALTYPHEDFSNRVVVDPTPIGDRIFYVSCAGYTSKKIQFTVEKSESADWPQTDITTIEMSK